MTPASQPASPSAASGLVVAATSCSLCFSRRSRAKARFICCMRPNWARSATKTMPPAAFCRVSLLIGSLVADRSSQGMLRTCRVRAQISAMLPELLRRSSTEVRAAACSSRRLRSFKSGERAKSSSVSGRFCGATGPFSAFFTVASSFCSAIGFSRKSVAPMRVASTAVSIVPCPDIITTGMVRRPEADHSLSRETPSVSGIQMSSRTRSGRSSARTRRALAAFSARRTECPSSARISERSSRMPISSSTTRICAMFSSRKKRVRGMHRQLPRRDPLQRRRTPPSAPAAGGCRLRRHTAGGCRG